MIFELPLTEEKVKPHQVTALHLLAALTFIGAGALLYLFYPPLRVWSTALMIGGAGLLYAGMFRNRWLTQKSISRSFRMAELVIALALTGFAAWQKWTPPAVMFGVLSAAVLFSLFWENDKGGLHIVVGEEGIKLPMNARRRFIAWSEVEQVLLKFGTLTVNCYDNRLYQWTIGKTDIDRNVFEQFCSARVEEWKDKRDKNDW